MLIFDVASGTTSAITVAALSVMLIATLWLAPSLAKRERRGTGIVGR
jgi:hypothetical protein